MPGAGFSGQAGQFQIAVPIPKRHGLAVLAQLNMPVTAYASHRIRPCPDSESWHFQLRYPETLPTFHRVLVSQVNTTTTI